MRLSLLPPHILAIILSTQLLPSTASPEPADSKPTPEPKPCTIQSATSGSFFDLNPISILPLDPEDKKHSGRNESWHAKGYDYGANFTLNFCAPVVEELDGVVGVEEKMWRNVSAFYTKDGKTYSIGQESSSPVFRGRKLVLNYTMGSPCDEPSSYKPRSDKNLISHPDDDDNRDDRKHGKGRSSVRRKSTLISLLCDRDPLATTPSVAFLGVSPDECTYVFEVRSAAACGGVATVPQAVGPGYVFGIIFLVAAAVYLFGGIAYQRSVMHQRGWRQIPNYTFWAGIGSFMLDSVIILTSSCTRCLPGGRSGYNQLPTAANGNTGGGYGRGGSGRGRGRTADDENRLIDQLDEEWDD